MKFSIIMPTFSREHCIDRAIKSIKNQTHQDWELIIVDSKPSNYSFDDKRIRYFPRKGMTKSAALQRNAGIPMATGEVITFFDDDDIMDSLYLETINNTFQENRQCKMVVVKMDANYDRPRLKFATPCCAIKRIFVTPTWQSVGQLQDQKYYRNLILSNRWRIDRDIIEIDKILVFVGHSSEGGLRAPNANF